MRLSMGVAAAGLAAACAAGDVRLPRIFGDGMVLQRESSAPVWGWADPGERVVVQGDWNGAAAHEVTTGPDGRWRVNVGTGAAGGPFTVRVRGKNEVRLENVLLGEVWVCSGQSNMEWPLAASEGGEEEARSADWPRMRMFTVTNRYALEPEADCDGEWVTCSAQTAERFSGVGYFFGRELQRELDVPIGLIAADWGGTPAEAWMPEGAVGAFPEFQRQLGMMAELRRDPLALQRALEHEDELWWMNLVGEGEWKFGHDDSGWKVMELPQTWSGELGAFDGIVVFRKRVELSAEQAGREYTLRLGPIDDQDMVWFNGVLVGKTAVDGKWNEARAYRVPAEIVKRENVIVVMVLDTGGPGGVNGRAEEMALVPVGGGARVSLAGEWRYQAGKRAGELPARPRAARFGQFWPASLFNGMIAPIVPMRVAGVIWYQGESNVGRGEQYRRLFPGLIASWREAFGWEMPFGFVQIAPFAYAQDRGQAALVREAQVMALAAPRTGMAVTMDIGDPADIHPRNKREVGRRLSLWALAKVYGREVAFSGPLLRRAAVDGGRMRVAFEHGTGLRTRDGEAPSHLWIAGKDRVFHRAEGEIRGDELVVWSSEVVEPVAVRYGWEASAEPNLENAAGLPAAPFRTDDWEDATPPREERATSYLSDEPGFVELFNGRNLDGWVNVNCDDSTWRVRDGVIACSGVPTGVLRTEKQYENFILEVEWKHLQSPGNGGIFVWSDALPARGVPFTRSIEVQVMVGAEGDWYTSDGDMFPIHGARMTPENGRGGSRAFPTEKRVQPAGEWNHYRITCFDGSVSLAVNGKVVTRGHDASPRKGFICLESEGSEVLFRNVRIKELPSSGTNDTAREDEGFVSLYGGVDFEGWKFGPEHEGHWKAQDWTISFDGEGADLWSEKSFKDFVLIADWRWVNGGEAAMRPVILPSGEVEKDASGNDVMREVLDAGDSGIYLRGSSKSQVNIWCWPCGSGEVYGYRTDGSMPAEVRAGVTPREVADAPIGQWNRFVITMKGELLTVELNGKVVIENARLPGVAEEGPIALQMHHAPIEFANVFVKELE